MSTISDKQKIAINAIEGGKSVLLLGRAGTGKSFILREWVSMTNKTYVLLASTGIAAIQIEGQTIHSFMGIEPGALPHEVQMKVQKISKNRRKLLQKLEVIVIDEISMVRADLLDCVDITMREVMHSPLPFGGKQVVMVGDVYQLPPVLRNEEKEYYNNQYKSVYFFHAHAFQAGFRPELVNLEYIYRQQQDKNFIVLLNAIRNKTITSEQLAIFNEQVNTVSKDNTGVLEISDNAIYLASVHRRAEEINQKKLLAIDVPEKVFTADIWGKVDLKTMPVEENVYLKIGARVMITRNDQHHLRRWVNGDMGVVVKYFTDKTDTGKQYTGVVVRKDDNNQKVRIAPVTWDVYRFVLSNTRVERQIIGGFTQIPLRLGWAITIHKAQGQTFSHIIVDLQQGTFAHGQLYVALSRCTTLKGVTLTTPIQSHHIRMDSNISAFMAKYLCRQSRGNTSEKTIVDTIQQAIANNNSIEIGYLFQSDSIEHERVIPHKIEKIPTKQGEAYAMWAKREHMETPYIFNIDRLAYVD